MFPRLKRQLHVFAPLGAGLLIITMVTALGGLWNYQNELNDQLSAKPQAAVAGLALVNAARHDTSTGTSAGKSAGKAASSGSGRVAGVNGSGSGSLGGGGAVSGGTSAAPHQSGSASYAPAANPSSVISVSLSVNGRAQGTVKLTSGSNQCDVLSQALAEGVISSLDMYYDSSAGSYGVEVINGIGTPDPHSVWWTYTVKPLTGPLYYPPGCSHVPAHNGDSVNWQYIKS